MKIFLALILAALCCYFLFVALRTTTYGKGFKFDLSIGSAWKEYSAIVSFALVPITAPDGVIGIILAVCLTVWGTIVLLEYIHLPEVDTVAAILAALLPISGAVFCTIPNFYDHHVVGTILLPITDLALLVVVAYATAQLFKRCRKKEGKKPKWLNVGYVVLVAVDVINVILSISLLIY